MSTVQLTLAKQFLNITTTDADIELQEMLDRAESILSERVGPLLPETVTDEVHTGPGPLVLRRYPVVSVSSATSGGVTVTDLDLDVDTGLLYGAFSPVRRSVKVTYMIGYANLPLDLEAAVLELVGHLWSSQRGTSPTALQQADLDVPQVGGSYLLPYRVQSLIEPHLIPPLP